MSDFTIRTFSADQVNAMSSFKQEEASPRMLAARRTIGKLTKEVKHLRSNYGEYQDLILSLIDTVVPVDPLPLIYKPELYDPNNIKVESPCACVFEAADQHMGEVVTPEMIERFGIYNSEIALQYSVEIVSAINRWVNTSRHGWKIPYCYYLQMGDPISGDIHEELKITNEFPVPEQINRSAYLNADNIRILASNFEHVYVHWIIPDNHSRRYKKPQHKEAGLNSYSYLIALLCKERVKLIPNVTFKYHLASEVRLRIANIVYLCLHGNGIKGGFAGIPYYGIDRRVSREAKKRMPTDTWFNKMMIAHFHEPADHFYWSIAGALCGTNELDHDNGRFAPPAQTAFLVHPKKGEFNKTNFKPVLIEVDDDIQNRETEDGASDHV